MNAEGIERSKRFESCESQKIIWGPFSFLSVKMMWQRAAAVHVLSLSQGAFHHHEGVSRHEHGGGAGIQVGAAFFAHDGHGKQAASGLCLDLRNAARSATGDGIQAGRSLCMSERRARSSSVNDAAKQSCPLAPREELGAPNRHRVIAFRRP